VSNFAVSFFTSKETKFKDIYNHFKFKFKIKKSKLLSLLNANCSEEMFEKFTVENKIELLKLISNQVLTGEKYNNHLESIRGKAENLSADVRQLRSELWEKIETTDAEKKKKTHLKDILKKAGKTGWLEQLEKKEKQLDTAQSNLAKTERFTPLGVDSKEQVYWYFPCFKQLVVEKKTEDVEKSQWYSFLPENVTPILDLMKKCKQDKLLTNLQETYEQYISKEIAELRDDDKSDNETLPDDESQNGDSKGLERFFFNYDTKFSPFFPIILCNTISKPIKF